MTWCRGHFQEAGPGRAFWRRSGPDAELPYTAKERRRMTPPLPA